jgi:hypothetical protein
MLAALPVAATALTDPVVEAALTPNRAGAQSTLHVVATGGAASASDPFPTAASAFVQRGFVADLRAVRARCGTGQAAAFACPAASRAGRGSATAKASGFFLPGGSQTFTASMDAYLAPAPRGALAGFVLLVSEPKTKQRAVVHGRLLKLASGPFGYELRIDDLGNTRPPAIPGITVSLERLEFSLGARRTIQTLRTVRRNGRAVKVKRRERVSLITNPRTCPAEGWLARMQIKQGGGDVVRDVHAACVA